MSHSSNSEKNTLQKTFEGLHRLSLDERLERIKNQYNLTQDELEILSGKKSFPLSIAEHLIENAIGYFPIPMGVATYFVIDGKEVLIPMVVEETSIIAAASATAKWVQSKGTIKTTIKGNLIIGQIQMPFIKNVEKVEKILQSHKQELIEFSNRTIPNLIQRGGGVKDIVFRELDRPDGDPNHKMLILHVLCDPCDAMGANLINQICEILKPRIEELTGESVGLCILSNLVDTKLVIAEVVIKDIDPVLGKGIQEATLFAQADPYRAATHNKGVLNGIDPILIATGNDWRAVEAGIHAYAARSGKYQPVTDWKMVGEDLVGKIEIPLAIGVAGGVTRLHPTARVALKILEVNHAEDLARICAAVGLVQNLGALKALTTVGIVKGHMQLHAANLAIAAGADTHEIAAVRDQLTQVLKVEKSINVSRAKEILEAFRESEKTRSLHLC